jgi:hypothetical protein
MIGASAHARETTSRADRNTRRRSRAANERNHWMKQTKTRGMAEAMNLSIPFISVARGGCRQINPENYLLNGRCEQCNARLVNAVAGDRDGL